jgi:hypothetical protein
MRTTSNLAVGFFLFLFAFSFAFGAVALVAEEAAACCLGCNCWCMGGKGVLSGGQYPVCQEDTCHWSTECECFNWCDPPQ